MKKIAVTYSIPEEPLEFLKKIYNVKINRSSDSLSRVELINMCKDVDGVICMFNESFDKELIDACPRLKVISTYSVGYNNVDVEYAKSKGIFVTNTPDVLTESTANLAIGLMINVARSICRGNEVVNKGKFEKWTPTWFLGLDLSNKTVGVVGMGRIGQNFARKVKAFNMRVIYYSNSRVESIESELGAVFVSFDNLVKESDFISLHVPLTTETRHMFSKKQFKDMKKSSILINTSRGAVIDEESLAFALINNEIYGAGLDVFEEEPEINSLLIGLDNVVLTPHIGSSTFNTRYKMAELNAASIHQALQGIKPALCVW